MAKILTSLKICEQNLPLIHNNSYDYRNYYVIRFISRIPLRLLLAGAFKAYLLEMDGYTINLNALVTQHYTFKLEDLLDIVHLNQLYSKGKKSEVQKMECLAHVFNRSLELAVDKKWIEAWRKKSFVQKFVQMNEIQVESEVESEVTGKHFMWSKIYFSSKPSIPFTRLIWSEPDKKIIRNKDFCSITPPIHMFFLGNINKMTGDSFCPNETRVMLAFMALESIKLLKTVNDWVGTIISNVTFPLQEGKSICFSLNLFLINRHFE